MRSSELTEVQLHKVFLRDPPVTTSIADIPRVAFSPPRMVRSQVQWTVRRPTTTIARAPALVRRVCFKLEET